MLLKMGAWTKTAFKHTRNHTHKAQWKNTVEDYSMVPKSQQALHYT